MRQRPRPDNLSLPRSDPRRASVLGIAPGIPRPLGDVPAPADAAPDAVDAVTGAHSLRCLVLRLFPLALTLPLQLHLALEEGLARPPTGLGLVL